MAGEYGGRDVTWLWGGSTAGQGSTDVYLVVVAATSSAYYILYPNSSAGVDVPLGVTQSYSTAVGNEVIVRTEGITKVYHDGTCTVGALVGFSTAGLARSKSTGADSYNLGMAIVVPSTASGTAITVLIDRVRSS